MAGNEKLARQFAALFKKGLTDKTGDQEKSRKQKDADYESLNFFVNGLKKKDDIQTCLEEYMKLYKNYSLTDRRSKFVFAQLLTKRLEAAKPDDKFIDRLAEMLAEKQKPFTGELRQRYEDLEQREKDEVKQALDYKLQLQKQQTSVIDLLKKAYINEKNKQPDQQDLLNYNPIPDPEFEKKFNQLKSKCADAWGRNDAEDIEGSLKDYISFLNNEKDILKLFQALKWMRDIVTNQPYRTIVKRNGEIETHKYIHDDLDCELYFQIMYRVLIFAHLKLYFKNRSGFTSEEKGFFLNPLASDNYYSNYLNRYNVGITQAANFIKSSVLFLRLLIFARITNAQLANSKETTNIRNIIEDKSLREILRKKSFYLNVGRDLFKGYVRIGGKFGKAKVIYFFDYKNDREQFIFIEFSNVPNVLLKVSSTRLAQINEDSFYTTVWENTKHLLVLIPAFWKLLGYLVTFLTGGFIALVKDVIIDVAIGEAAEHLGGGDASTAGGVAAALLKKGKLNTGTIDRAVSKGLKNVGEEELKAAKATANLTSNEAKAIKSASKYADDQTRAMKAVDDLIANEAKAVNTKTAVVNSNTKAVMSPGNNKVSAGTQSSPKMSTADDAVRNNGTGKVTGKGGGSGGNGGGGSPVVNIPQNTKVIEWNDAMKMADDLGEKSQWVKKLDDIKNLPDPAARNNAISKFRDDYFKERGIDIEVITKKNAARRNLDQGSYWRYDPAGKKLYLHEDIFNKSGVNAIDEIRKGVKSAEINHNFRDLIAPHSSGVKLSGVPVHLKGTVNSLEDVAKVQGGQATLSFKDAYELSKDLHSKSIWMAELGRIGRIEDTAKRLKELKDFIAVYSKDTPVKIQVLKKGEAEALGLGQKTGNWGKYLQNDNKIMIHEDVLKFKNAANEVGHEVGAAELYRVFGINKDAIPFVPDAKLNMPNIPGQHLTHVLDRFIRQPD